MDRVGFLGAGNMAYAISGGIPNEIWLYNHHAAAYDKFKGARYHFCDSVDDLVAASDLLVLSVKPQSFPNVLPVLAKALSGTKRLIVSIAAGITLQTLSAALPEQKIVRVMPNTPLLVGMGATVLCRGEDVSDADFQRTVALFAAGGVTAEIKEEQMNAEIALHGSSPAIFYEMADMAVRYGVSIGLSATTARDLFCQTMMGSAKMLLSGKQSPKELSKAVCSPGGTTLAMLEHLNRCGWEQALLGSFTACGKRADELAKKKD